jgi:hypothetical protein
LALGEFSFLWDHVAASCLHLLYLLDRTELAHDSLPSLLVDGVCLRGQLAKQLLWPFVLLLCAVASLV